MHVPDDTLEEYAMGRLDQEEAGPLRSICSCANGAKARLNSADRIRQALRDTGTQSLRWVQ